MQPSITRVVKLTLQYHQIDAFKKLFAEHTTKIAEFEGCLELKGFQDSKEPQLFFTISRWQSEQHLDNYRFSDFFKSLWSKVKPMFADKAEAHSMTEV
ncbi:MAG TPA: antibiotic biosynthesis monooxygenase [Phnomibacter sp.]|nr:antibiotic biosynthesis monooxygenase [Phnomibacter sp.]